MKARTVVVLLIVVLGIYMLLVGWRGLVLVNDGLANGDAVGVLLGLSVLVFPIVGGWLVWREVQFGRQSQALAEHLAGRGALPVDDLPRRPSGRVEREAAQRAFDASYAAAQERGDDPAAWYALALSYNDLGDRRQARASMREAIRVWLSGDTRGT